MSPNLIGALLMTGSMACFTLNDTFIKLVAGGLPLFQLIFLRGVLTCLLIWSLRNLFGGIHFRIARGDWHLIAIRTASEVGIAYFFLSALTNMPLANVTAIMQVAPLAITLASALFLKETVGWRRTLAVTIGFCGVLLIVQPGADGFTVWSLYVLAAVAGVVLRDLVTRRLSPDVPSMTVTLMTAVGVMVAAGLASTTEPWLPVAPGQAMLVAASATVIIAAYYLSIQVMRMGEISFTAPFRYSGLLWALILGWFVFGEWPSTMTLLGAAIVVAMGIYTLLRGQARGAS